MRFPRSPKDTILVAFPGRRDFYLFLHACKSLDCRVIFIHDRLISSSLRNDNVFTCLSISYFVGKIIDRFFNFFGLNSNYFFSDIGLSIDALILSFLTRPKVLCTYQPYAYIPFRFLPKTITKVLFQYHPVELFEPFTHSYHQSFIRELFSLPRFWHDKSSQFADLVFCASSYVKDTLLLNLIPLQKIKVFSYPVPPNVPIQTDPHDSLCQTTNIFQITYIGSFSYRKGADILDSIVSEFCDSLPTQLSINVNLNIVSRSRITDQFDDKYNTTIHNNLSDSKKIELLRNSDVFLMPSRSEGFGFVYLEALAQGTPVVGTFNSCLPDFDFNDASVAVQYVQSGNITDYSFALHKVLSMILAEDNQYRQLSQECLTLASKVSTSSFISSLADEINLFL